MAFPAPRFPRLLLERAAGLDSNPRSGLRWRHRAEHTEKGRVCEEEAAEQTCRKDVPGESHLLVQAVVAEGGRRSDPTGAGYDGRACGPRGRLLRRADRPRD